MLYPNENYNWRILAYGESNEPITSYSNKYPLKVMAPSEDERSLASSDNNDDLIDDSSAEANDTSYFEDETIEEEIITVEASIGIAK